jgi:uncharacterized SAM-binding protein YcdF (DUF218 family)
MLENLAELFKSQWIPGSATFFVYGLILAAILLFTRRQLAAWGRRWLIFLTTLGYLLSTPLMASSLVHIISSGYQPLDADGVSTHIDAIVILGGGGSTYQFGKNQLDMLSNQSSLRVLEGYRLYLTLSPEWVIVSGGTNDRAGVTTPESETMATHLVNLGIPAHHILIERESANTHDQAVNIPPLLARNGIEQFILVTSPIHMRRADLCFRAAASDHLISIAPARSETKPPLGWSPFPNAEALDSSRDVVREVVGLLYYLLRGWL